MTGAARLTPGRGSPFVQRDGAIRRPEPEEGRARLGGAAEPAKLLREIENVDFSQGRHWRSATGKERGLGIEKFGLHRDRGRPAVAVAKPGCGIAPGMRGPSRSGRVMVRSLESAVPRTSLVANRRRPPSSSWGAHRSFWRRQAWHRQRPPGCENTGGAIGDSIDLTLRLARLAAHRVPAAYRRQKVPKIVPTSGLQGAWPAHLKGPNPLIYLTFLW